MTAYHAYNKNTITETRSKKKMKTAAEIYYQKIDGNDDFLFDRKIQTATDGLQQHYSNVLFKMLKQNALAVADFNQYEFRN